jgi:lactoylglutathione lyase
MNTETNVQQAVPFLAVSSMEESYRYYVEGLGFTMTKQWVVDGKLRWCWLENGGAALMLQEFLKEGPDAWVPLGKLGIGVTLCFICADARVFYQAVTSKGVQAGQPYIGNGMWVTEMNDPDGYQLLFESVLLSPEEGAPTG